MNRSEIANEICAFPGPPTIDDQRYIVRFLDSCDFERFLLEGRSGELREEAADRDIRPLPLIQAVSCPAKEAAQLILALGDKAVWEIDAPVRASALSKGAIVTDKGIPWGVRRIQAPQAWGKTTGYRVKVGVIDTGVDYSHPDLKHSLERGINLLSRMSLPQDDNGHGTHIAGTIAAANELQGMIGVAPRSMIYPVKAFDHNGTAFVSDIVLGIEWCVRNHMDVVNMSFGMRTRSRSLLSAVNYAYHSGVLIVASSGNSFVHETESQLVLNGSYDIGFTMDLALKDLGFALAMGRDFGAPLDLATRVNAIFEQGKAAYGGDAWSTQIVKLLEDAVGTELRAPGFPARLEL